MQGELYKVMRLQLREEGEREDILELVTEVVAGIQVERLEHRVADLVELLVEDLKQLEDWEVVLVLHSQEVLAEDSRVVVDGLVVDLDSVILILAQQVQEVAVTLVILMAQLVALG